MSLKLEWQNAQLMTCKSMLVKSCWEHCEINKAVMQLELELVFWEKTYVNLSGCADLMYFRLLLRVAPNFLHRISYHSNATKSGVKNGSSITSQKHFTAMHVVSQITSHCILALSHC